MRTCASDVTARYIERRPPCSTVALISQSIVPNGIGSPSSDMMNLLDVSPLASSRPHGVPEVGVAYSGQHCFVTLDVARGVATSQSTSAAPSVRKKRRGDIRD